MKSNINISTIDKYFSQNKGKNIKSCRTTIVNHSFFAVNEATICHKISLIPYYSNYFSILDDYEDVNISQLNDNIIERLKEYENMQYYLFKYQDNNSVNFIDKLYDSKDIKKLILDVIGSFSYLMQGLLLLNANKICFFDFSPKNIVYLQNFREKPVLKYFRMSLNLKKLDYIYISHIINHLDSFTYQPLEIHILCYLIKDNLETISYAFIEEFCENYIENLNILRLFSDVFRINYKKLCIETMRKYINRSKNEIVDDILERNNKWDVYGISMLYLQIFGCISKVFSQKDNFISKITIELSKNLHPDSSKRLSLEQTLDILNKLLREQQDWRFVNFLDNKKLEQLFDEFAK